MICTLPGQNPVEKGIVIDGTPCLSDSICVDGMCVVSCFKPVHITSLLHMIFQAVGCNGILGSEEKTDECARCGSTSGICLRVPCIVNHPTTNGLLTSKHGFISYM